MKKAEKAELDALFTQFVKLFQSRCWACKGKYNKTEAFVAHHREYREGEKTYKDFKINGKHDKLLYYKYLTPIIIEHHKAFRLLHHKHHYMAESQARPKPLFFERMVKLSREINKRKYPRD